MGTMSTYKRKRYGGSYKKKRWPAVKRIWKKAATDIIRPNQRRAASVSEQRLDVDQPYFINHYDSIGFGDGQTVRSADVINVVPGGYTKIFIRFNPTWLNNDPANPLKSVRIRILRCRLVNQNIDTTALTAYGIFDKYFDSLASSRMGAIRRLDELKTIKVLSDRVITLQANTKPFYKKTITQNWRGKVTYDTGASTPNNGFYFTMIMTDEPRQLTPFPDPTLLTPLWCHVVHKDVWVNVL